MITLNDFIYALVLAYGIGLVAGTIFFVLFEGINALEE